MPQLCTLPRHNKDTNLVHADTVLAQFQITKISNKTQSQRHIAFVRSRIHCLQRSHPKDFSIYCEKSVYVILSLVSRNKQANIEKERGGGRCITIGFKEMDRFLVYWQGLNKQATMRCLYCRLRSPYTAKTVRKYDCIYQHTRCFYLQTFRSI